MTDSIFEAQPTQANTKDVVACDRRAPEDAKKRERERRDQNERLTTEHPESSVERRTSDVKEADKYGRSTNNHATGKEHPFE